MTRASNKSVLDGIQVAPAPVAGAQGKYLRGDGTWQTPPNTTYGNATGSNAGLMSPADKTKLDNVELVSVFSKGYARNIKNKVMMKYNPQFTNGKEYKLPKISKTTDLFCENHKNGVYKHYDRDTSKRYPYNIIKFNIDKPKVHPTQKPLALCEYMIETYTNEGDLVLDNCMGSGTTGLACKNLKRRFIGIEKEEKYFEIAKDRINNS